MTLGRTASAAIRGQVGHRSARRPRATSRTATSLRCGHSRWTSSTGFDPNSNRLMRVALALCAMPAPREREATCEVRLAVTPFSRTCPNGGTGRRAHLASVCRQRRAGSNPASGTPSNRDLTRRAGLLILQILARCACRLRLATKPAALFGPRVLCFLANGSGVIGTAFLYESACATASIAFIPCPNRAIE